MSFQIKKGDTLPALECVIQAPAGSALDLTSAVAVKFIMSPRAGGTPKVDRAATIVTPGEGRVKHVWQAADTDTAGSFIAEWEVDWGGGNKQTFPRSDYIAIQIIKDLG